MGRGGSELYFSRVEPAWILEQPVALLYLLWQCLAIALRRLGTRDCLASSMFLTLTQSQMSSDLLHQLTCVGSGSSPVFALDSLCDLRASPCPL